MVPAQEEEPMMNVYLIVLTRDTGNDWQDLKDPQWGLLGKACARKPHPACALCFTVPALDAYQIYEYIETDLEEAIIISRMIPNPAPPYEGIWKWVDEDGLVERSNGQPRMRGHAANGRERQ